MVSLPAPIVNGGRDSFWKWPSFQIWRARDLDLDLESSHTEYLCASLIDLYVHAKFHWNRRNIFWTDGRTDGHLRPALLGRLCWTVDIKHRFWNKNIKHVLRRAFKKFVDWHSRPTVSHKISTCTSLQPAIWCAICVLSWISFPFMLL